jgi:hypothetical protein
MVLFDGRPDVLDAIGRDHPLVAEPIHRGAKTVNDAADEPLGLRKQFANLAGSQKLAHEGRAFC